LAGDIGGTKPNLGLFLEGKERPVLEAIETFSSRTAPDLEHIIRKFLQIHEVSVTHACFGVAGPVVDGRTKITNLPWHISQNKIKKEFNFDHVGLVNDLTATAMAISLLKEGEFFPLNHPSFQKSQNMALIAPGTGLGTAILFHQNGSVFASGFRGRPC
jgi:glucokinase